MKKSLRLVGAMALAASVSVATATGATASDEMVFDNFVEVNGTVDLKYSDGRLEQPTTWKGTVPNSLWIVPDGGCLDIVATAIPFVDEADRDDLEVEFAIWSNDGREIASETIYGFDWNPSGGPTQARIFDCDWTAGDYTMYVTTQLTTASNGLVSRYVEGKQTIPVSIKNATYCVKKTNKKSAKYVPAAKCPKGYKKAQAR